MASHQIEVLGKSFIVIGVICAGSHVWWLEGNLCRPRTLELNQQRLLVIWTVDEQPLNKVLNLEWRSISSQSLWPMGYLWIFALWGWSGCQLWNEIGTVWIDHDSWLTHGDPLNLILMASIQPRSIHGSAGARWNARRCGFPFAGDSWGDSGWGPRFSDWNMTNEMVMTCIEPGRTCVHTLNW